MATDHVDHHALGNRLEAMIVQRFVQERRQEQGIQYGLWEAQTGARLFELQKAQVERRIVADEDGVLAETVERRQYAADVRLTGEHAGADTVNLHGLRIDEALRIDQLIERLGPQQTPVDD